MTQDKVTAWMQSHPVERLEAVRYYWSLVKLVKGEDWWKGPRTLEEDTIRSLQNVQQGAKWNDDFVEALTQWLAARSAA